MISAPSARTCSAVSPVTVARVPTGMKAGVSTAPCAVTKRPRRARVVASSAPGWKEKLIWAADHTPNPLSRVEGEGRRVLAAVGGLPLTRLGHAALHRVDEVRPQAGGRDDPVERADLEGTLDAVDAVELVSHLAQLLGADAGDDLAQAGPSSAAALGRLLGLDDARILAGAGLHLAREDHRRRRRPADDGRARPLHRHDLHLLAQRLREHHEGAAVI